MGNLLSRKEPPPPMVLVPPLFDFPPIAARTRALESTYNLLFGKLALRCLFEDYFEEASRFRTRIMLKPTDDPHVDLVATLDWPMDDKEEIVGNAQFRWQNNVDNPHTFIDLLVANADPVLMMRSSLYDPKSGIGAFFIYPLLMKQRVRFEDNGVLGVRYGSSNLSAGATFPTFSSWNEVPKTAWLVHKMGRLTAGLQYEPKSEGAVGQYADLANWSCALGYALGSGSPLSPSFNFGLELRNNNEFIASFYQHMVVQRRIEEVKESGNDSLRAINKWLDPKKVKNPFEENQIVGITNYIDFGFELHSRVNDANSTRSIQDSSLQFAASWQANKNFLLKGKVGPLGSSIALAFKSWWKPSFTFSLSAATDRKGQTAFGFGIRVDNVREAIYQRADPNFVMLTPNKEHLAEGIQWKVGERPLLQSDVNSGNFDGVPRELRPLDMIL